MVGFVPFRDFLILYSQQELKMDLGSYGRVMGITNAVQMGIFLALGPVVDRLHPLRAGLWGYVLVCVAVLGSLIFIRSSTSFSVWIIIIFGSVAIYQGASGAVGPLLLPRAQYGQFCAASAVVFHLGQMLLTPLLGVITDRYGYRPIFVWFFVFSLAGTIALYLVYRDWLSRGGDESFQPP
jgi:MFS-type transporter involved in bile tolerance (Atg22 family)